MVRQGRENELLHLASFNFPTLLRAENRSIDFWILWWNSLLNFGKKLFISNCITSIVEMIYFSLMIYIRRARSATKEAFNLIIPLEIIFARNFRAAVQVSVN